MKILIENSGYALRNMGDLAMLQVGVSKISTLFPSAEIYIYTSSPDRLAEHKIRGIPVDPTINLQWARGRVIPVLGRWFPESWYSAILELDHHFKRMVPLASQRLIKTYSGCGLAEPQQKPSVVDLVRQSDLIIATGGGYLTDSFSEFAMQLLVTIELGQYFGKPTAIFGNGLGPLKDIRLAKQAARVFPRLQLLGLREGLRSPALARQLGAPVSITCVTGDDAVGLAHGLTPQSLGNQLGINIRCAEYSGVSEQLGRNLVRACREIAEVIGASTVSIPISFCDAAPDLQPLVSSSANRYSRESVLETPETIIRRVGQCRLVVTGSYHAGVFALSQGVPVVGVAVSQYYVDKFEGLSKQFGSGCQVHQMGHDIDFCGLRDTVCKLWENAPELRPDLLKRAKAQTMASDDLYERLRSVL